MRRVLLFLSLATCLPAAEFWESKALGEWSDKDIQKLVSNSPWAKPVRGTTDAPTPSSNAAPMGDASTPIQQPGIGRSRSEGLGAGPSGTMEPPTQFDSAARAAAAIPEISVTVRWLTSLPMRQAQMRAKYGKEAITAPAAKQYIETEPAYYTLGVGGVPGLFLSAFGGDRAKEIVEKSAALTMKGKDPVHAAAVQFVPNGANIDVLIAFPRSAAISLADQEVEFSSRLGSLTVRNKFRLKDMQVHGKLEL